MSAAHVLDDSIEIARVSHPITEWSRVAGWIERSIDEQSLIDITDIFNEVCNHSMMLWTITAGGKLTGTFVTKIETGSRGKALCIIALGGEGMDDWIESFSKTVSAYGKDNRCRFVFEMGRPGWTRVLDRLGWVPGPATMMKVL